MILDNFIVEEANGLVDVAEHNVASKRQGDGLAREINGARLVSQAAKRVAAL